MKNIYRRRWFRILPLIVLAVVLFADIIRVFIPSSNASGTGFSTYHDSFYGYSISYPKDWKITHGSAHVTMFVAAGKPATCQVSIQVTRKALTAQKALMSSMPKGAYSISHKTIDGSPALAFSQYSSSVQSPDDKFNSASTKKAVVAQPNTAHGVNLYTLSLDMFRGAFMRSKNTEPHTTCESNFEVMTNSLVLATGANGLGNMVPSDASSNQAIVYADANWNLNYYNGDSTKGSDCPVAYDKCTFRSKAPNAGLYQPQFQCAEFVARALAAEGFITLDPYQSNSFDSYKGYNLTNVGTQATPGQAAILGLFDLLTNKNIIGGAVLSDPTKAVPGDIIFYDNSSGIRKHTALIVDNQNGNLIVDAHNWDEYHVSNSQEALGFSSFNVVHLPPAPFSGITATLFDLPNYDFSGSTLTIYSPGAYQMPSWFDKKASSIYLPSGWGITVYQTSDIIHSLHRSFATSVPDLSRVTFENSSVSIDNQISYVYVVNLSTFCFPATASTNHTSNIHFSSSSCQTPPCPNNSAVFITDVTYPDGTAVSPGQSFNKTWRLQNTSANCTWSGYTLNFINGAQLGGPSSVSVPTTGPGQTVDITVPLVAPTSGGTYRGNWQLEDSQGVDVSQGGGGTVWVQISVPYSSGGGGNNNGGTDSISASYPSVVTPGQHFQPRVTVTIASGQLLQSRGDMLRNKDGNLYGAWPFVAVTGTVNPGQSYTFTFYANNPIVAPGSEGTYSSVWQLWQNGTWYGPTVTITFMVKNGGGTKPNVPTLVSPANWDYERGGATPTLCASSSSSNVQYDIQIFQGTSTPDSGWISANCWTPPTLGPNTFAWHAKVRDNASGLESDWSDAWNFSIASQQLTMDPLSFNPSSPSAADGSIAVRSCVHGFGDVNLGLSYQINSATDGSANGVWHGFTNSGNNCPDLNNSSTWGQLPSRDYADGDHLVEAIGTGPQGQTMIVTAVYHLNHRRPQDTILIGPINNVRVNSDTVTFVWRPSINANYYRLVISANADMSSPLFDQNVGTVTSYQYTFSQDYSPLYWQVHSLNDLGQTVSDITPSGIDRVPPTASVNALPATTTDTTFTVTWSGSDNDAGVEWYNVQYRDGNDPNATWVNWQTNTTAIAALFTGEPGHTYYFRAQAMDKAANLSTYADGNGDTNTFIDLNARPATPWWNQDYTGKRDLIILNNDTQSLPAGYPIHLHFDASTTPSAGDIYNASLSANPGDDIGIVYQDKTGLPRFMQAFTSTQVDIWFDLQASLGPNPATDTTSYQLYYGDPKAVNPPGNINSVLPPGMDSNTMGVWYFQDGSGTSVIDSSGKGHTGTINNGSWNQNGKFGPSVVFNGASTTVNLGDSSDFNFSSFTLEGWFKFYAPGIQDLIRRDNSNQNGDAYNLGTRDGKIEYGINGRSALRSHTQFQANQWYHIAATYDGTTMAIYINGVLDASQTDTGGTPPSVGPLMLGNNRVNSDWFKGEMQGVRVSNIARTSFSYGAFANIQSEPSTNGGSSIAPPQTGTPSLAVQSVNVIPNADGSNTLVTVVQNQGNAPTGNGFSTDLYLNHQPTGPGDYTGSVNSWVASPIDSNQNITLATTISTPSSLLVSNSAMPAETTQTFYVQADSTGALSKYDQSSLTITGPISVCTASSDTYENDNSPSTAKSITTNGVAQVHNFHGPGDQDWVSFTAKKGMTYVISTSNLGPNADTVLALYGPDGATLLTSNDDYNGTPASLITWKAPAAGTYHVQVTDWSPIVGGCGTDYNLSVKQSASITSTPTSTSYNQTVQVSGKAFAANEPVNLYLDSTSTTPVATTTASSTGTISTSFKMPQAVLGMHTIYAVGQTSKKLAISTLQVKSNAVLSKGSGVQGANISLTGYGFLGYVQDVTEVVNVYWGNPTGPLLGSSPTNGLGTSGTINFTVPTVPSGTYTLYIVGQASGVTLKVPFKVIPSLAIKPASGGQGSTATLSGTGFGANETVTIQWNCATKTCTSPTVLGTVTTTATGNFNGLSVTIPSPVNVGKTYPIGAIGGTSNVFATTRFTVTS